DRGGSSRARRRNVEGLAADAGRAARGARGIGASAGAGLHGLERGPGARVVGALLRSGDLVDELADVTLERSERVLLDVDGLFHRGQCLVGSLLLRSSVLLDLLVRLALDTEGLFGHVEPVDQSLVDVGGCFAVL